MEQLVSDWICASCDFTNNTSNEKCTNCGKEKTVIQRDSDNLSPSIKISIGKITSSNPEWKCDCGHNNLDRKEECKNCNKKRKSSLFSSSFTTIDPKKQEFNTQTENSNNDQSNNQQIEGKQEIEEKENIDDSNLPSEQIQSQNVNIDNLKSNNSNDDNNNIDKSNNIVDKIGKNDGGDLVINNNDPIEIDNDSNQSSSTPISNDDEKTKTLPTSIKTDAPSPSSEIKSIKQTIQLPPPKEWNCFCGYLNGIELMQCASCGKNKPKFNMILPKTPKISSNPNQSKPIENKIDSSSSTDNSSLKISIENNKDVSLSPNFPPGFSQTEFTTDSNSNLNQLSSDQNKSTDNNKSNSSSNSTPQTKSSIKITINKPTPSNQSIPTSNSAPSRSTNTSNLTNQKNINNNNKTESQKVDSSRNRIVETILPKTNKIKITINKTEDNKNSKISQKQNSNFTSIKIKSPNQPTQKTNPTSNHKISLKNEENKRSKYTITLNENNKPSHSDPFQSNSNNDKKEKYEDTIIITINEWECSCGYINTGKRDICTNCCKEKNSKEKPAFKKSDWVCFCGYKNFARREDCFSCTKSREKSDLLISTKSKKTPSSTSSTSSSSPKSSSEQKKDGKTEWTCLCGFLNFSKRDICKNCSRSFTFVQKKKSKKKKPVKTDYSVELGWSCQCGTANSGKLMSCKKCGKEKKFDDGNIFSVLKEN